MKEIWNKRVEDLTFGDTMKINLAALGIVVGVVAVVTGVEATAMKIQEKRLKKAQDKYKDAIDTVAVEV